MEGASLSGLGNCGNCLLPFAKQCSKVKRIIVAKSGNTSDKRCEEDEEIISIYEALSGLFEFPPFVPQGTDELLVNTINDPCERAKLFEKESSFRPIVRDNDGRCPGFALCVNCSEMLKTLYMHFKNFISSCKVNSDIGQILAELGKKRIGLPPSESNVTQTANDEDASLRIMVKTEPGSEDEQDNQDAEDDDQTARERNMDENVIIKLPPAESDSDEERDTGPQSPQGSLSDYGTPAEGSNHTPESGGNYSSQILRNSNRNFRESECAELKTKPVSAKVPLHAPPKRISVRLDGGRSFITQLKCPRCSKQFLHKNTLICHRRIIHGEIISLRPPEPMPQMTMVQNSRTVNALPLADDRKISSCPICRMEISRSDIRNHLATHTRSLSKPWLCTICGKNFNDQESLHTHAKVHTIGIPCKRCGKKIPTLEMLNHIRKCLDSNGSWPQRNHSCKICHKSFQSGSLLFQHRSRVHGHVWKCRLCGIKFTKRETMLNHMNTHKQKKSHKCKICDKCFDRIDVLRLHIKRFHMNNEGPQSVPRNAAARQQSGSECNAELDYDEEAPTSPVLNDHSSNEAYPQSAQISKPVVTAEADLTTPVLENRFACKGCPMTFCRASELDKHLVETHADDEILLCKICNRKLQDSYCLKLHVKTHGEMKPLECFYPSCGKIYRDKNTFFYHLKEKHGMDTKSIIVKYPDVFRQQNRDYSTRIMRKKVGQTPSVPKKGKFPCETCGRVFPTVYGVRSHVKLVHDKVKDFLCKFCGKAFARKSYFLIHEKLHTSNEAPYKCHLCGKGFRLPGNLRMHLQSTIHNPNRDYVCDICGKGFNRNDNLRLHVKTVHLKIPVRKPKSEQSDRYAHGGRHRIYLATEDPCVEKAGTSGNGSAYGSPDLVPPSCNFFIPHHQSQNQTNSEPSLAPMSFQRHPGIATQHESPSADTSIRLSGNGTEHSSPEQALGNEMSPHSSNLSLPGSTGRVSGQAFSHGGDDHSLRDQTRTFQYRL